MAQTQVDAAEPTPSTSRWQLVLKVVAGLVVLAAVLYLARIAGGYIPKSREWVEGLGFWGPLVFIVGYAVATVAFIPGSVLTALAGAIFGIVEGTTYVFIGASAGATAAFLIARYLARSAVESKLTDYPRFAAIDSAIARKGRTIVFLLRLSPVFPFVLLNYGLGLTKVRLLDYVLACFAMLPGTLAYVYLGSFGGDVATAAAGADAGQSWIQRTLLAVGLVATLAVTTVVTRLARKALQEVEGLETDS